MNFDQNNPVVKLCARGMELSGETNPAESFALFTEAWEIASNDMEKFIAAHYIARHQETVSDKLKWDQTALNHALNTTDSSVKAVLPSLYLNIGKCHEEMNDNAAAFINYQMAASYVKFLSGDGYGRMIQTGIEAALSRVNLSAC